MTMIYFEAKLTCSGFGVQNVYNATNSVGKTGHRHQEGAADEGNVMIESSSLTKFTE